MAFARGEGGAPDFGESPGTDASESLLDSSIFSVIGWAVNAGSAAAASPCSEPSGALRRVGWEYPQAGLLSGVFFPVGGVLICGFSLRSGQLPVCSVSP